MGTEKGSTKNKPLSVSQKKKMKNGKKKKKKEATFTEQLRVSLRAAEGDEEMNEEWKQESNKKPFCIFYLPPKALLKPVSENQERFSEYSTGAFIRFLLLRREQIIL